MIEWIMIFALGFFSAALLALILLPAVNRRTEWLAKRRFEALFPVSLAEITAERDHLRAEFAVTARQLERRMEVLSADKGTVLEEAGRRAIVIKGLEDDLAAQKTGFAALQAQADDLARTLQGLRETLATTQVSRDETSVKLAAREAALRGLEAEHRIALDDLDARQIVIAGLETRLADRDTQLAEAGRSLAARLIDIAGLREDLADRERRLGDERTANADLTERLAATQVERDEQARRIDFLAASEGHLARSLTEATLAAARRETALANEEARHVAAARHIAELEARVTVEAEAARSALHDATMTIAALSAEKESIERALGEDPAAPEPSATQTAIEAENEALRARIEEVAADIVKLARPRRQAPVKRASSKRKA